MATGIIVGAIGAAIGVISLMLQLVQQIKMRNIQRLQIHNMKEAIYNCRLIMSESWRLSSTPIIPRSPM